MIKKDELKKDVVNCIYLCILVLSVIVLLTRFKYEFGSKIDWETQHYEIPSYFRQLFYDTHDLFPDFAKHIGAGQNIYNLSYYGFLSPIILFSYLLPFVSMENYIQFINIFGVIVSVILCYRWLRGYYGLKGYEKRFSPNVAFLASFLFACSSPLIYQAHRQIMFVSYMPFLFLTLEGVDSYIKRRKSSLMIVSAALMIYCSYFFSVSAFIMVGLYTIGECIRMNFEKRRMLKVIFFAALNICIGIFMSGILTIPTLMAILGNRGASPQVVKLNRLIVPTFNGEYLMYSAFSPGLTAVLVVAMVYAITHKKVFMRFYGYLILVLGLFPVFAYLLNGKLYLESKSMIPFVIIGILLEAEFLNALAKKSIDIRKLIRNCIIFGVFSFMFYQGTSFALYAIDLIVTLVVIDIYRKNGKKIYETAFMIIAVAVCVVVNYNEKLLEIDNSIHVSFKNVDDHVDYIESTGDVTRVANDVLPLRTMNKTFGEDYYVSTIYSSVCNKYYKNFYHNEICNENPYRNDAMLQHPSNLLFNIYMGEKYLISQDGFSVPHGYKLVRKSGDVCLYKSDDAFSIGYVNTKLMSRSTYNKLAYPYRSVALLYYCVVDDDTYKKYCKNDKEEVEFISYVKPLELKPVKDGDIEIHDKDEKKEHVEYIIPDKMRSMILFVKYKVDNSKYSEGARGDLSVYRFLKIMMSDGSLSEKIKYLTTPGKNYDVMIDVNNIRNKLTYTGWKYYNKNTEFYYCLSDDAFIKRINYDFYSGKYNISDFSAYSMNYMLLKDIRKRLYDFEMKRCDGNSDVICGHIKNDESGFFVMSIPYDKGFTCYVDGKKTDIEKVDTAFMGFYLEKGEHDIRFEYRAPGKTAGIIMSIAGIIMYLIKLCLQYRRKCANIS